MFENKDRKADYKYIGIDLSEKYLAISQARIESANKNVEESQKDCEQITFDDLEVQEWVKKD